MSKSLDEVIRNSEVIIVGHGTKEFNEVVKKLRKGQILMKLT